MPKLMAHKPIDVTSIPCSHNVVAGMQLFMLLVAAIVYNVCSIV